MLYALHMFDIVRKHQRLLTVDVHPRTFSATLRTATSWFIPVSTGYVRSGNDETVIGMVPKWASKPYIDLVMEVSFDERAYFRRREVIAALNDFAGLANSIISLFDSP